MQISLAFCYVLVKTNSYFIYNIVNICIIYTVTESVQVN
jgi:hypothetical protein